jgi:hypothetical protein
MLLIFTNAKGQYKQPTEELQQEKVFQGICIMILHWIMMKAF